MNIGDITNIDLYVEFVDIELEYYIEETTGCEEFFSYTPETFVSYWNTSNTQAGSSKAAIQQVPKPSAAAAEIMFWVAMAQSTCQYSWPSQRFQAFLVSAQTTRITGASQIHGCL